MESTKFKTVDEYFAAAPTEAIDRLKKIRKEIKKVAPLAEEVISYNMPALKYGKVLIYYAGYKKHIGFYAIPTAHKAFENELSAFKSGKGSVQFPNDRPLPLDLIKRMTKYRYEENLKL